MSVFDALFSHGYVCEGKLVSLYSSAITTVYNTESSYQFDKVEFVLQSLYFMYREGNILLLYVCACGVPKHEEEISYGEGLEGNVNIYRVRGMFV